MNDLETIRLRLYGQLVGEGRAATSSQVAAELGMSVREAVTCFRALADDRHIVLNASGEIEMAHPFATRDFGFSVKGKRTLWWGGCAWDSFAIPHLVDDASPALIATTCPACGAAHAWNANREAPPAGEQIAHFLVPMSQVWDDVVHACENQRIFCSESCVDDWLERTGQSKGSVFSLEQLWHLAAGWYAAGLSAGYLRREPAEAAAYFRSVGLSGQFWGN